MIACTAGRRDGMVVRDHHQGRIRTARKQQLQNLVSGFRVQVAGRFVG